RRYMWKTLVGNLAVTGRFAHILPAEAAQIHCGAEDLVFLRRPYLFPDAGSDGDIPSVAMVDDKQPRNVADILDSELDHTANHCLFLFCIDSPGRSLASTATTLGLPG
ncbi:hypothetical protein, partial [Vulcanococcus limneticus]|uniref:hypothetical protein n=1 Tax=Vulcanococcus limneticus TaxID=2170428 RepID=UPI001E47A276